MAKVRPTRKIKDGASGKQYNRHVACGEIDISVFDDSDGDPVKVMGEYNNNGCEAMLEGAIRSTTLMLKSDINTEDIINQYEKVFCSACRTQKVKGRDIHLSCYKAIADVLRTHIESKKIKNDEKTK